MLKFVFSLFFLYSSFAVLAQDTTLTKEEKVALDSMFRNDEFFKMLNEKADTSYIDVSLGVSNGVFSLKNNSLNTEQSSTDKIFFTPSVGYFHKSGFGISATGFLTSENNSFTIFQYAISPAYSYYSKPLSWGLSYTRYIKNASADFDINPYKNDLYGSFVYKKTWLRPAIGGGYSTGKQKEYFDSVITFFQVPRTITIRDTITTKLSSFSLNLSVSHIWSYENVFLHNDEIELQPSLVVNGSNQKLVFSHSGNSNSRRPVIQKLLKYAYSDGKEREKFSVQSVAFMGSIAYGKGKFIMQPQLYLDYYLSETNNSRFSALYSFVISYAF